MDCKSTAELLPWLLNGTLAAPERAQVMQHLAGCLECRLELGSTASAWEIFAGHVPAEMLLDHASGRAMPPGDAALIAAHLESCPACAEQNALLTESLALVEESAASPRRAAAPSWFRWQWALAAALLLTVTGGGWFQSARQAGELQSRLQEVAAGNRRLEERVRDLAMPRINVATLDVFPRGMVRRSTDSAAVVIVPNATQPVTVILNSQNTARYPSFEIEIADARGTAVWSMQGLQRNPTGDYTISLPSGFLAPGGYTIAVFGRPDGQRSLVESYSIRVP